MAILSNGFGVILLQKRGEEDHQIPVDRFYKNERDFYERREDLSVEVKENMDLSILFQSDRSDAKLYLDGLDTLPERLLQADPLEGEVYLAPAPAPVTLFANGQDYYPLIPGFYRIVVEYNGNRHYNWMKVIPKQLEENQWEVMRDEVEKELEGLARDVILRKTGISSGFEGISPGLLGQFIVIQKLFSSVMAALSDLYTKVNYRISKEYVLVPKEKSRLIDERTIRHRVSHPENEHVLKTPVSAITYDLPENRLAKSIITSVSQTLSGFIEAVEAMEAGIRHTKEFGAFRTKTEKNRTLAELERLGDMAVKMRGAFQWIKTAPWYESVSQHRSSTVPHVMASDPRYRALYQLHRELNNEQLQMELDQSYAYQWKRTDKLYEIWGVIQFIKVFLRLGYKPEKGWVYNDSFGGNSVLVPTLPSGTEVVFSKNDIRIHLVYESVLPTQSRLTTKEKPLYTRGTHTAPDGRIDVYKSGKFIGSVIFDFKYRPRHAIWDQTLIYKNQPSGGMRQLVSYGDNLHSPFLFGGGDNPIIGNMSPVQEVWALFPSRYSSGGDQPFPDHKLRLVELTPGEELSHLDSLVDQAVNQLVKRSEPILDLLERMKV